MKFGKYLLKKAGKLNVNLYFFPYIRLKKIIKHEKISIEEFKSEIKKEITNIDENFYIYLNNSVDKFKQNIDNCFKIFNNNNYTDGIKYYIGSITNFSKDINILDNYLLLNNTAICKIIKKFDKIHNTDLQKNFLLEIKNEIIFQYILAENKVLLTEKFIINTLVKSENILELQLIEYIEQDNVNECIEIFKKVININYKDYDQRSILHIAVFNNNPDIIREVLKLNPLKDLEDRWGNTVLDEAVEYNFIEIYKILKDNGFKLSTQYHKKMNYNFIINVIKNKTEKVKKLLNFDIDINTTDYYNRTALHLSCLNNNLELVKILIKNEANYSIIDKSNNTAIDNAVTNKNREMIEFLKSLDNKSFNNLRIFKLTKNGDLNGLTNYIELGFDINIKSDSGYTLLDYAIINNQPEIVKFLLSIYKKKNMKDKISQNTIDYCQNKEILNVFEQNGFKKKKIYKNSSRLLEYIYKNDLENVKLFISKNPVDINLQDYNKQTPLHLAACVSDIEIFKILLDNGAKLKTQNIWNNTPIDNAILYKNIDILKYLKTNNIHIFENKNKYYINDYLDATESNNLELIKLYIDIGLDINICNSNKQNALHISILNNNFQIVKYLVENNILINEEDIFNCTALEYSQHSNDENITKYLINYGAKISKNLQKKYNEDIIILNEKLENNLNIIEENIREIDPTITDNELNILRDTNLDCITKLKKTIQKTNIYNQEDINEKLNIAKIKTFQQNLKQINMEITKINPEAGTVVCAINNTFDNLFSIDSPSSNNYDNIEISETKINETIVKNDKIVDFEDKNNSINIRYCINYFKNFMELPIIDVLKNYELKFLKHDIYSGILGGLVMIPAGLGYGILAGFENNPLIGVHSMILPSILYAFFGSCKHLSVGPISIVCLLIYNSITNLNPTNSTIYKEYTIILSFLVGMIYFILNLFKLGDLVSFLSKPVLSGFSSATAVITIGSMIKYIFGTEYEKDTKTYITYYNFIYSIKYTNIGSIIISLVGFLLLFIIPKIEKIKKIPASFLIVILAIGISFFSNLENSNVPIIGNIEGTLPDLSYPKVIIHSSILGTLLKDAFFIACIGFIESIAISKYSAQKHNYKLNIICELNGLCISNIMNSFVSSIPVMGSFSRTILNMQNKMKTQLSSIISSIIICLSLLILSPIIYYLPKAILGVLIITSVMSVVDIETPVKLWSINKADLISLCIAFFITLILGIDYGMIIAILFSILSFIKSCTKTPVYVLGRKRGTISYYEDNVHYNNLIFYDNILIIKLGSTLFFGNSEKFKDKILELINEDTEYIILDFSCITNIDYTSGEYLNQLIEITENQNKKVIITHVTPLVYEMLNKCDIIRKVELKNNIHNAVKKCINIPNIPDISVNII